MAEALRQLRGDCRRKADVRENDTIREDMSSYIVPDELTSACSLASVKYLPGVRLQYELPASLDQLKLSGMQS